MASRSVCGSGGKCLCFPGMNSRCFFDSWCRLGGKYHLCQVNFEKASIFGQRQSAWPFWEQPLFSLNRLVFPFQILFGHFFIASSSLGATCKFRSPPLCCVHEKHCCRPPSIKTYLGSKCLCRRAFLLSCLPSSLIKMGRWFVFVCALLPYGWLEYHITRHMLAHG